MLITFGLSFFINFIFLKLKKEISFLDLTLRFKTLFFLNVLPSKPIFLIPYFMNSLIWTWPIPEGPIIIPNLKYLLFLIFNLC